jgi:hypothetical protein
MTIPKELAERVLWCAFGLYSVNMLVGVVAQLRWFHFGKAHHVLYFVVFSVALAALASTLNPWLLLTIAALAVLPKSRPGTWWHPICAMVGFLGFGLAMVRILV